MPFSALIQAELEKDPSWLGRQQQIKICGNDERFLSYGPTCPNDREPTLHMVHQQDVCSSHLLTRLSLCFSSPHAVENPNPGTLHTFMPGLKGSNFHVLARSCISQVSPHPVLLMFISGCRRSVKMFGSTIVSLTSERCGHEGGVPVRGWSEWCWWWWWWWWWWCLVARLVDWLVWLLGWTVWDGPSIIWPEEE